MNAFSKLIYPKFLLTPFAVTSFIFKGETIYRRMYFVFGIRVAVIAEEK